MGVEAVKNGNGRSVLEVVKAFEMVSGRAIKNQIVGLRESHRDAGFADA
jgi:UDP-glucose 4-epimerase